MLADVGMLKTYSNSTHVNDLGFAWTSPPCYYVFSARWFCHTLQVRTAPSLHLPLFLEETFLHTLQLYIVLLYKQHSWSYHQVHKDRSLRVLGICQLVGHRLVVQLLLRPQLVVNWLVMHALAKDSPCWPVTDLPCVHANLHGRSP